MIYRFACQSGLQDADASLVTQDVLVTVARTIHRFEYDPNSGSFRGWLKTVTRSRLVDFMRAQGKHAQGSGDTDVHQVIAEQSDPRQPDLWEREYRRSLFEWAVGRIQCEFEDRTWQAFWRTSVEAQETETVAETLEMSTGAVYIARSRVLARLREEISLVSD